MIDLIVKFIVQLITGAIDKALYLTKRKKQRKEVQDAKNDAKQAKEESDASYADFKLALRQYRKQPGSDLREHIRKVQHHRRKAAGNDSKTRDSD